MRPAHLLTFALLAGCGGGAALRPAVVASTRSPAASDQWWNGAVVYQVFVRSFRDSDGDGKGDLKGLISKLDYLNDGTPNALGVDAIWLMPIFPSPSYHGYDVTDYDGVNPTYGSSADMDQLLAECHRRGVKVILDWVPNHTSTQHPWFRDATAATPGPHRDWYVWSPSQLDWTQPWGGGGTWYPARGGYYYGVFWSGMPDLNWRNPAVRAEMAAAAVRWLTRSPQGIDGFRLDAIRYLVENGKGLQQDQPETHQALRELSAALRAARPDVAIIGEAWAEAPVVASYYGSMVAIPGGDEVPLPIDFPVAGATVSGLREGAAGAASIAAALDESARLYPAGAGGVIFLTNHDQVRLATQLGASADPARLRLAAAILLTLQGTPAIYYGEEIGLQNGDCPGDECKRTPMPWDSTAAHGFTTGTPWWPAAPGSGEVAAQSSDPESLLSRYRRLIRLRKSSPALRRGGLQRLPGEGSGVLAWLRTFAGETVLVAHNLGVAPASLDVAVPGSAADPMFVDPGGAATVTSAGFRLALPASGSGVWSLR